MIATRSTHWFNLLVQGGLLLLLGDEMCADENIIQYRIDEGQPVGQSIGQSLNSKLSQIGISHFTQYVQVSQEKYFAVSSAEGDITIKRTIDLEDKNLRSEDLELKVWATGYDDRSGMYTVKIEINDINDNSCHFEMAEKRISFLENTPLNTAKEIPSPIDPDENFSVRVDSIALSPTTSLFYLKKTKSLSKTVPFSLDLVLNGSLDYETKQQYSLTVTAHDGEARHTCKLRLLIHVIDVDDNPPKFSQTEYTRTISEGISVGATILQLEATDADQGDNAKIIFNFDRNLEGKVTQKFVIDKFTGRITLREKLRFSEEKTYRFQVRAHSGKNVNHKSKATVLINVLDENDEAPEISVKMLTPSKLRNHFGPGVFPLLENKTVKNFLHVQVKDDDTGLGGEVDCKLTERTRESLFTLDKILSKSYFISPVRNAEFDREKMDSVNFTIRCTDRGDEPRHTDKEIMVKIVDQNDNPPVFNRTRFYVTIMEDSDPMRKKMNYQFAHIAATDADSGENAKITYSVSATDNIIMSWVHIDPNTAVLSSKGFFDKEEREEFSFTICARNDAKPHYSATTMVSVKLLDYNDHRPKFSNENDYHFEVKENEAKGFSVGKITASDNDSGRNAKLNFSFVGVPSNFPFALRETIKTASAKSTTFELYITGNIDRELTPNFKFTLRATDGGHPMLDNSITVFVDVLDENDNRPEFTYPQGNASLVVSYHERPGFQIATITAIDRDAGNNGKVFYRLQDQQSSPFSLDRGGALVLKQKLKENSVGVHRLVVFAYDSGTPPTQNKINIDIHIDKSAPQGRAFPGHDTLFGDASMNLYIIIGIVVASFVIAMVLLTAICVVLRRSRREMHNNDNFKNTGDYVMCPMNTTTMSPAMTAYHSATLPPMPPQTNREVTFLSAPSVDNIMLAPMKPPPPYHAFTTDDKRSSMAYDDRDSGNGDSVDVNTARSCTIHGSATNTISSTPANDFFNYPSASSYANSTNSSTFASNGLHSRTLKTFGNHNNIAASNCGSATLSGRHTPSDSSFYDNTVAMPKLLNSSAMPSSSGMSGTLPSLVMSSASSYPNPGMFATSYHPSHAESRGLLVSGFNNQPLSNHSTMSNKSQGGSFV